MSNVLANNRNKYILPFYYHPTNNVLVVPSKMSLNEVLNIKSYLYFSYLYLREWCEWLSPQTKKTLTNYIYSVPGPGLVMAPGLVILIQVSETWMSKHLYVILPLFVIA